ncbi:MAG TPA: tetratricopeptide repeat protein [Pyrinomonadaceae bacterium]|nr:tetratricopeptide repeat protein [Pyrinomonadaceae bacterium]
MSVSEELLGGTKEYDVFELVTDALEYVDKYEKSKDKRLLKQARDRLKRTLKIDPRHFKGRYFQAMVYYLDGNTKDAIKQFNELLHEVESKPLANEISYNLAAAHSEARDWQQAINLFNKTINNTRHHPALNLLARAGLVKTHAEAKHSGAAEYVAEIVSEPEIEAHYVEIHRILSLNPFRWLLSLIRGKKRIDKKVREKVEELIADARAKEGLKFPASRRLPLMILIGIILLLLVVGIAALLFVSYGVRLQ